MNILNKNLNFRGLAYSNDPIYIILHHAEARSCSVVDIHNWHLNNGWSGCGYHYLVRKNGSVERGRPDNAIGAHCLNYNSSSIGICCEGSFQLENMSNSQYKSLIDLIKYLKTKYNIRKIYGHKELNSTDCPGRYFPLSKIKCYFSSACGTSYPGYLIKYNPNKKDSNVTLIQRKLISSGYNIGACGVDGYFGGGTLRAIKNFQQDNGLMIDGIIGINTWNKLMK